MNAPTNFFHAETAIKDALATIADFKKIGSYVELDDELAAAAKAKPAAFVIYGGGDVTDNLPRNAMLSDTWLVVVVNKHASASEVRLDDGQLLSKVFATMQGLRVERHQPFEFKGVDVRYVKGGLVSYILEWSVKRPLI